MNAELSEPLGVGKLLGDTIKLIFTKGWWLMPLAMLVTVPAALLSSYLVITIFSYPQRFDSLASIYIASLAPILVQLVIYFLASALLTFAAYDAVLSRRIRIGYYIGQALRYGPPIILLSLLTSVLIGAGLILVIVPGLYLAACFYVLVPAIMIEQAGFSGMGRSLDLTNGYRFSIVGLVLKRFGINLRQRITPKRSDQPIGCTRFDFL
ncbi:hypothetical protein [Halovulum sp. GXIMD14793]